MIRYSIDFAVNYSKLISDIELETFGESLKKIYEVDKQIKAILAFDESQLIGFLTFKKHDLSIEIYNLAVLQKYRRQKVGSSILKSLEVYDCSLEVRESNEDAIAFYKKQGFEKSHIRKNYYPDEDAIVLERGKCMEQKAFAKINLILNVIDKLDNGYHEIEFLMNSIDLFDVVKVTKAKTDSVIVKDKPQLSNENNLAYKALKLMREKFGFETKYQIEIEKNIPIAAGMAGGSTDAAALMRIVNELENLGQSDEQLAMLGAEIGSDIPFCIHSKLAIARGRGEKIELLSAKIPTKYILVVNPGVELSTQKVYNNHKISTEKGDIDMLLSATDHKQFESQLFNSLEVTASELCSELIELKLKLEAETDHRVIVSGSGPTLLVFSEDYNQISELFEIFKPQYENTFITKMDSCI